MCVYSRGVFTNKRQRMSSRGTVPVALSSPGATALLGSVPAQAGAAAAPGSAEGICRLFSILCLLSVPWGPSCTSLPRFSQMAALQPRCCLFIHLSLSKQQYWRGNRMRQVSSPSKEKKGTCQFAACASLRLGRLSQSVAPLLKASSHPFTTRRLLFSEKLGFRDLKRGQHCMAQQEILLHLGNFPWLKVGLTAALWQQSKVSGDPLWDHSAPVVLPWG